MMMRPSYDLHMHDIDNVREDTPCDHFWRVSTLMKEVTIQQVMSPAVIMKETDDEKFLVQATPGSELLQPTLHTLLPTPENAQSATTPYTPHPAPCTLHSIPYTLHSIPYTLHPTPCTLHPTPYTLHLTHLTPSPQTPNSHLSPLDLTY